MPVHPPIATYQYQFTSTLDASGEPDWGRTVSGTDTSVWAPAHSMSVPVADGDAITDTSLKLMVGDDDTDLKFGRDNPYYFQVRAVNTFVDEDGEATGVGTSEESPTDSAYPLFAPAGWTFSLEPSRSSLIAGETGEGAGATMTFKAVFTPESGANPDRLWANWSAGSVTTTVSGENVGFAADATASIESSYTLPLSGAEAPICTDEGTFLECTKPFDKDIFAKANAALGSYNLVNTVSGLMVTAQVNGNNDLVATPSDITNKTLEVTLNPTEVKGPDSTLPGVTGKVYAPVDAGEITAAISRSDCNSRIGTRSVRVCADVESASEFEREDASIEMMLDSAAWTALKYKESGFTFHRRSDSSSSWAAVPKCATDPDSECYNVEPTANADGMRVVEVKNIASFGQFALARRVAEPNAPPNKVGTIPEQIIMIGSNSTLDVGEFFRDPDNDRLRYVPTSSDTSVVTASVSGSTVVFNMVRPGATTMTVIAIDPTGGTAFQSFAITVQPANVAPEAEGTIQDQVVGAVPLSIDIDSYFSDADGDNLTYTAESDNVEAITVDMTGSHAHHDVGGRRRVNGDHSRHGPLR